MCYGLLLLVGNGVCNVVVQIAYTVAINNAHQSILDSAVVVDIIFQKFYCCKTLSYHVEFVFSLRLVSLFCNDHYRQ